MIPRIKLASAKTPDGGVMELHQHNKDFFIKVDGQELMNSRQTESEMELARLGCRHLLKKEKPSVLIGGLGMGFTLRETLDILRPDARIIVSELLSIVVDWNREFMGELTNQALDDERTEIVVGDVLKLISKSENCFDAILMDIDNGPSGMTVSGNSRLYSRSGIYACRRALSKQGSLAFWSVEPSKPFEELLVSCDLHVRRYRALPYKGSKTYSRYIWVASREKSILPPGGGEPRPAKRRESRQGRGPFRRR